MQTATNEFKNNIKNGCPLYGSCKIVLADGTVLTPSKDDFFMDSSGFRIVRSVSSSSSFDIGTVTAAELDLKLINYDGHLNDYDFENARIENVNVNMEKSDGTIESIPKGIFYVDTQDFNGGIVTLVAYDKLADMDKPYSGNKSGTVKALITAIADKYGIVLSNSDFNNNDFYVSIPSDDTFEYTDREILSYLCQVTCNYAYIDVKGYLVIAWYDDTKTYNIIDAQSFKNPSTDLVRAGDFADMENKDIISAGLFTDINRLQLIDTVFSTSNIAVSDVLITGIKVIDNDGNEYSAGEEGYVLTIESNPFINSNNAQEIANRVWQVAEYTRFRPMTVSILPNPLLDVGDCVYILIKDNYYETVITNISFAIGQFTDLAIGAESPSKNASYNSKVSAVTKKAINQSANKVSALSSQFANLITQSLGMYEISETQNDGSIITYLANKPTLAESIGGTVWRMALDIFTVTTNYQGSETVWENGFDSEGNLKANVLEVVGIRFDWAKGGTIELGGYDDISGRLTVKDINGNIIASISKDGVDIVNGAAGNWQITNGYLEFFGEPTSFQYGNSFVIDDNGNVLVGTGLMSGIRSTRIKDGYIEYGYYEGIFFEVNPETGKYIIDPSKYIPMTRFSNGMQEIYKKSSDKWEPVFYYSLQPSFHNISMTTAYAQLMRAVKVEYKTLSQLSSRRYKENVKPMDYDDVKKILSLNPCRFDYINGDKDRTGMIAEEVLKVIPECVTRNENGEIHGLDYTRFIPYMIKTIQEQEKRIKILENYITESEV